MEKKAVENDNRSNQQVPSKTGKRLKDSSKEKTL
jgi:hypothetical protein